MFDGFFIVLILTDVGGDSLFRDSLHKYTRYKSTDICKVNCRLARFEFSNNKLIYVVQGYKQ